MIFTFSNSTTSVIHDLCLQCLTQTLSKMTSNSDPEGVCVYIRPYLCFFFGFLADLINLLAENNDFIG
jgi:hypothetical protein